MSEASTEEIQRSYVRAFQDVDVPCPSCRKLVNVNAVRDSDDKCPVCSEQLRYCLGAFGQQWLEVADD